MISIARGLIALVVILLAGIAMSSDRKKIDYKHILLMLGIQIILTFFLLGTSVGISIITGVSGFFGWLLEQAGAGTDFVFGGVVLEEGVTVFFFHVLLPIILINALIGILNYTNILPFITKWLGKGLNKITGSGELESFNAISSSILANNALLTIKEVIPKLSRKQLFTVCLSATSAAAATSFGAYMELIEGNLVVVAVILNIFSALILNKLVNPYDPDEGSLEESVDDLSEEDSPKDKEPFFSMLSDHLQEGFQIVVSVMVIVFGFISLLSMLDSIFELALNISFTEILGYIFAPIAYIMGIPSGDVVDAGSVMATKLITNEFAAIGYLVEVETVLSAKTYAMLSTYVISFANFGTMGILTGVLGGIDKNQKNVLSKDLMKLLTVATLASMLTAAVTGFFY
ncbi:NupC/NupG family nucleoside CNT transporter [Tetragenococcus muriaticus]|uniref:Nucleoside permease n=1 Tax=Tetragenococcus muriaticus 3MR10-3 TaxID=1302648 RepID=A0A091C0E8_9ENTE|nr:nucleoside transporter C-terminal domain-containing protein [Tetragenococcus muriaticus]KFN89532.1 nucleoside permease [Tetragenococcus muriaticus 3MR10-3]GMA48002.1 NupC/NupG family nucleoside CNT transporter [Tetragenococcus muriaticus]